MCPVAFSSKAIASSPYERMCTAQPVLQPASNLINTLNKGWCLDPLVFSFVDGTKKISGFPWFPSWSEPLALKRPSGRSLQCLPVRAKRPGTTLTWSRWVILATSCRRCLDCVRSRNVFVTWIDSNYIFYMI